jgi:hypothetical protein
VVVPLTRLRHPNGQVDKLRTHISIELVDEHEVLHIPLDDV